MKIINIFSIFFKQVKSTRFPPQKKKGTKAMETIRTLINKNVYEHLEFYTSLVYCQGENAEYLGIKLLDEPEKFVKGALIHSTARLYLHYDSTKDKRTSTAFDKLIYAIRLLKNDVLRTWGKLNALRGTCALFKAGKLAMLPEDCIELLRDRTDIDDFYDREKNLLNGAATNYYQVAMACAGYREMLGWGIEGESDRIKNKLLEIMTGFSAEGWMDEQPPFGRYDRYSIIISSELIDTLNALNKESPDFAIKNLKDAVSLALACANPHGDGVVYGRSLSVHGDCAMLELLATAFKMGLVEEKDKPLALSYCGAILRKTFNFWVDKSRNSYNLWLDGRTTNNYRQVRRLLEVNLDMDIHMLATLDNAVEAGCADDAVDTPLPESPYGFSSPYKTVFSSGEGDERVLYSFVEKGKLYQLPLIGTGQLALNAAYQPFPAATQKIEAHPESHHPFLVPHFTAEDGRKYIPSGFYHEITDDAVEANGSKGTRITAKGNMSLFLTGEKNPAESNIPFTAVYTFLDNKITLEYTAHTEAPLTCRVLYAYGESGCAVRFNGVTPEAQNVEGDPAFFTPHGGITSMIEYESEANSLTVEITL